MNSLVLPPSVTARSHADHLSSKYVHVNTQELLDALRPMGFEPASVKTGNGRSGSRFHDPYAQHHVDLRRTDWRDDGSGVVPRILLVNSHDGSSGVQIMAGAYRFVCSNGLVIGHHFARERVRHVGAQAAEILERVSRLAANTQPLFDAIERWGKIELRQDQQQEFGRLAAHLRWGDADRFSPELVTAARRPEDARPTLWNLFNRIQENSVRGGFQGLTTTGRSTTARPLSAPAADVAFNAQLWQLTEEIAEEITA